MPQRETPFEFFFEHRYTFGLIYFFQLLLLIGLVFTVVNVRFNSERVNALIAQNQQLQQIQAEQAQASARFIQSYLAEANYTCRVVGAFAAQYGIEPPAPGTCSVSVSGR